MGVAESAFETGQFVFEASVSVRNFSMGSPSTCASRSSAIEVMANPAPTFEMSTAAVTLSRFGAWPASVKMKATVMAKHDACAAPRSSSGFVTALLSWPLWTRALNEYGCARRAPLSVLREPLPLGPSPSHSVMLLRIIASSCSSLSLSNLRLGHALAKQLSSAHSCRCAAVDVENLAGNEGGRFEIENRIDDVLYCAHASQGMNLGEKVVRVRRVHRRLDGARRDGVDPHTPLRDLDRERLRQRVQTTLGDRGEARGN